MKRLERIDNFNDYELNKHLQLTYVGMASCAESKCRTDNCDQQVTVQRDDNNGYVYESFSYIEVCQ